MRILITTQVFPPEVHPTAVMVRELAEGLSQQGFGVTVAAGFPHQPGGRLYPGYRKSWQQVEQLNGFRVARSWHLTHPSPALLPRALVMASQSAPFLLSSLASSRPEVVISFGPPLLGPLCSADIASFHGARLITVIYDLYPDLAIESVLPLGNFRSSQIDPSFEQLFLSPLHQKDEPWDYLFLDNVHQGNFRMMSSLS